MNHQKIVLVGLPGSGKTTLGIELADQLGFSFYDLDELIEAREKTSIAEIFSKKGEGYFRNLETAVLEEYLQKGESFILSTGGGAPCFNKNMVLINKHATSVYLDVPITQIMGRLVNKQVEKRPLFYGLNTGEIISKLKSMYAERQKFYEKANIKLSGEDLSTEHLISEWLSFLKIKS